jgi:hypothetical protein
MGFIAYNDTNMDNKPNVQYTTIIEQDDFGNNVTSDVITDSEAEFYFALGGLGAITVQSPTLSKDATDPTLEWGIRFTGVQMAAIPINMDAKDYDYLVENLAYIEMGFSFTPYVEADVATEGYSNLADLNGETVRMGQGLVKLEQSFGLWNGGAVPTNTNLTGLDFAVVFISTLLHFHLNIDVAAMDNATLEANKANADAGLLNETEVYSEASGSIKVGRDTGDLPVASVDIAGPQYIQNTSAGVETLHNASTCTIPMAFLDFDASSKVSYSDYQNPTQSLNINGMLAIEASIMIYCVNYPTWNGSGDELIHDPTFSVFMEWDNPGFIAVFLAIGSLTLVAVAAIMITKRKNRL